jgi:hypothetical protein
METFTDRPYTSQTCFDTCFSDPLCSSYAVGRTDDNFSGHCKKYRKGCAIDQADVAGWDFFSQQNKEAPSRKATVCTHKKENSQDQVKIDACKDTTTMVDEATCIANVNCQWTPTFDLIGEKKTCSATIDLISKT